MILEPPVVVGLDNGNGDGDGDDEGDGNIDLNSNDNSNFNTADFGGLLLDFDDPLFNQTGDANFMGFLGDWDQGGGGGNWPGF